jgi:YidC/Oxa1 family membrane protein insertase
MTEQQRVLLAVGLTFIIFWVWQVILGEIDPPVQIQPEAALQEETIAPEKLMLDTLGGEVAGDSKALEALMVEGALEVAPKPVVVQKQSATLRSKMLDVSISNEGASLSRIYLKEYTETVGEDGGRAPVSLAATVEGEAEQAKLLFFVNGQQETIPLVLEKGGSKASLRGQSASGLGVVIDTRVREGQYGLDYDITFSNRGAAALEAKVVVEMGLPKPTEEGGLLTPSMQEYRGICMTSEEVESFNLDDTEEGPVKASLPVFWAGLDKQYFVVAAALHGEQTGVCEVRSENETIAVTLDLGGESIAPGQAHKKSFSLYLGPKREDKLEEVEPHLTNVIEYNIMGIPLAFIARPMIWAMNVFHGWFGSWGMAIILLTLGVKSILFPITYKSVVSMRKMQLLKPELDKIKARFPDDREKQQMEQIRIFKEKGVNPLGGCLPMLLQMPVWFALYRALWTAVDLYQQPFLWIVDLTAKEPFPFLALALGGVTFLQQKLTPTTMDNDQARIMMFMMPIMLTVIMVGLPSGLVLYIFVNSVLTIGQQLVINKRVPVPT